MLALFESAFAKALLDSKQPIPVGIGAPGAVIPTRRLAVHRNNMIAGLVNVLKGRFPVVEKIVGEEFFGAMAGAFVRECPPRSPVLASTAERALAECPRFDLTGNLAGLIGWGLARRIVLTDSSGPALP